MMIKEVHITSLSGCPRRLELESRSNEMSNLFFAPIHIVPLRGIILHSALEQLIRHGDYTLTKEELLKERMYEVPDRTFNIALKHSKQLLENARTWFETTNFDIKKLSPEVRITRKFNEITVTGQIDAHSDDTIIDFKQSKQVMRKSFLSQLAGYSWLLDENKEYNRYLIFFGGNEPTEVKLTTSHIKTGDELFRTNLLTTYKLINEINSNNQSQFVTKCKTTMLCAYCEFRSICDGV